MQSYADVARKLVDAALDYVGTPYVWGGKGGLIWTPRGLVASKWSHHVLDCSGLITRALKDIGGPDWRGTHSARLLREECERECPPHEFGTLHFYGKNGKVSHVAIALDHGLMLEAAGGDQTTLEPKEGAKVRVAREHRLDFIEAGRLPLERLIKS